ncbi:MAG: cell wall hydrolase [Rhodospirillales bacterium]|nr:cell wall hydrolase [Rhodospirillales bacterium]
MKKLEPLFTAPSKSDAAAFRRELEIDVLARTIWGEARGEGSAGMQAVANVVLNRARRGGWWGDDVIAVCQKPYQFSCWNKDDPNYRRLQRVDTNDLYFATAKRMARRAVYGALPDITEGADHYHAAGITPLWSAGERPVAVIGNHIFYKLMKG